MTDSREDFKQYWRNRYPAVALGSMEADWAWVGWRECAKHYADRIGELEAERNKALSDMQEMVAKAASKHLPAYVEQQCRIGELEEKNQGLWDNLLKQMSRAEELETKLQYEQDCHKEALGRVRELEAQRVPEGIRQFVRMWEEKPIRGLDKENIYTIHGGTEWEAGIRFSDLKAVVEAAPPAPTGDSISPLQRQMDSAKQEVGSWPKQKREAMRNAINKKGGR